MELSGGQLLYLPWRGSRVLKTLGQILALNGQGFPVVLDPFRHTLTLGASKDELLTFLSSIPDRTVLFDVLRQQYLRTPSVPTGKFDLYVPQELLADSYVMDELDVQTAQDDLKALRLLLRGTKQE